MFLQGFFAAFATLEDLRYPLLCLFLPLAHQLGTDVVLGRYLLERLFPLSGLRVNLVFRILVDEETYNVGTDETGTACDENVFHAIMQDDNR